LLGVALSSRWLIVVNYSDLPYPAIWCNTLARLDPIAVGAVIALGGRRLRLSGLGRSISLVVGAAILVDLQRWWPFFDHPKASDIWAYLAVGLVVGGMVLATIAGPAGLLGHPALVYLGRISYGLYAWHGPIIRWAGAFGPLWWPVRIPLVFALTMAVAAFSYRLLEQPFLQLKKRFTYVTSAPV
jgi:peptidoglycan/LPS O-acetylase OafA/YrhL